MADKIPRRMRRFHRSGQALKEKAESEDVADSLFQQLPAQGGEKAAKEITMHLTLQEVKKFKKEHKRYPKKDEYDQIAESIYLQLKDNERRARISKKLEREKERAEGGRKKRRGKEEELPEPQPEAEPKPMLSAKEVEELSVSDILAEKKPQAAKEAKDLQEEDFSLPEMDAEKEANKCPNCGKEAGNVLFCPECGTAFCPACAKAREKVAGKETLTCPSCGKRLKQ